MKIFQVTTLATTALVASTLVISACDGGSSRRILGKQCSANLEAIPKRKSKIAMDSKLPDGRYVYAGADLVYRDNSSLVIHVVDVKQKDGHFKAAIECVRNAQFLNEKSAVSAVGIERLEVSPDKDPIIVARTFGFKLVNDRLKAFTTKVTDTTFSAPGKVFEGVATTAYFSKLSATDYAVYSNGEDESGKYELWTKYVFVKAKK